MERNKKIKTREKLKKNDYNQYNSGKSVLIE